MPSEKLVFHSKKSNFGKRPRQSLGERLDVGINPLVRADGRFRAIILARLDAVAS